MYRDMEAEQRAQDIAKLAFQLDVLNGLIKGPYVNGVHLMKRCHACMIPCAPGASSMHRGNSLSTECLHATKTGNKLGLADAALFPTLTFCRFMLAPFFGWAPIFDSRPALGRYWATMEADEDASRVDCTCPPSAIPIAAACRLEARCWYIVAACGLLRTRASWELCLRAC